MFNLGTRSILINSNSIVTGPGTVGTVISIAGFGKFTIPSTADAALRAGAVTVASDAVAGVYTITPTGYVDTATYDIVLGIQTPRAMPSVYPDGARLTFQTKAGSGSAGASAAAGQLVGYNDNVVKFSGTSTIIATLQPGMEGATVDFISVTNSVTGVPLAATFVVTVEPKEGIGLGKIIEEEVQNLTCENLDPWRGGMETVDIRGKYTEITWQAVAGDDDNAGWEPHAFLGYGDVNTVTAYGPRTYTAYVNEVSGAATIALLSKLVAGVDGI